MRKFVEKFGAAIGTVGGAFFTFGKWIGEFFTWIGLPEQIEGAIMTIAGNAPTYVGPALLAIGAVCVLFLIFDTWFVRRERTNAITAPQKKEAISDAVVAEKAAIIPAPHQPSGLAAQLQEAIKSSKILAKVTRNIDDISRVYEEYETEKGNKELRLKFIPDTDTHEVDSLVAICYVYKAVRGLEQVSCGFAEAQVTYLLGHAPNAYLLKRSPIFELATNLARTTGELKSAGVSAIKSGLVERVNLSFGGSYRLTSAGEMHAERVIKDMIRRA